VTGRRAVAPPSLRAAPWWTDADGADLDVLVHELVERVFDHRGRCEVCAAGYPPCPCVGAAIDAVIGWRAARILKSKAAWLRLRQDRIEGA
jgi:hypothetical protein